MEESPDSGQAGEDEVNAAIAIVTDILMDHFWGEARHLQLVAEEGAEFALTELEAREIATKAITALVQKGYDRLEKSLIVSRRS